MAIIKWDPWRDLLSIPDELERFFGRTFAEFEQTSSPSVWSPYIDMLETNGNLVIKCELAGVEPEDVEVTVDDESLTIKGERKFATETKEESYHRIERRYGAFRRVIPLPVVIDKNAVTASFMNGLLEVRMPKQSKLEPKRIKVEVEQKESKPVEISGEQKQ